LKIRAKLSLLVAGLFTVSLGVLGWSLVALQKRHMAYDNADRVAIVMNSVERAARDALLQKDDVLLVSYVKFLQLQYPVLAYCRIRWVSASGVRSLMVGSEGAASLTERTTLVRDPMDGTRKVTLAVGIDQGKLQERIDDEMRRLTRDLLRLFGIAIIVAVLFADWFARRLTRPLAALSDAAAQIAKGKLDVRLQWSSKDEIGALVEGFNHMSERLEDLDQLKRDFVSSVTHELRSPLGAIESFLNLIESKSANGQAANSPQVWEYFGRIKANVRRLSGFINDLLDVAKIERGKMECQLKPMKIQEVADEVTQFFEAKCKEQGVALANRLEPNTPEIQGDPERLRQVLVNLISNALKFTPAGGHVWIQGESYREGGQRYLELAVADTGRGMDEEDLRRLFQKFQQGKNVQPGVAGPKGTGLGLFIVKSIVESHGGKVSVRSAPGKGTQFLFNLRMV